MPIRLDSRADDFAARFGAFLAAKREAAADVEEAVRGIIAEVMARGDAALDRAHQASSTASIVAAAGPARHRRARSRRRPRPASPRARDALGFARDRIEAYHRRQLPADDRFTDALGVELGWRWTAIEAVGLYVPGGTAAYPSSVLMNAMPAKVAGVAAHRHGGAGAGRQAQSAGAGRRAARRRRRDLPRRRRAGGGGAGLRHRDHRAGRQDRRPRQRLCRRGQARWCSARSAST